MFPDAIRSHSLVLSRALQRFLISSSGPLLSTPLLIASNNDLFQSILLATGFLIRELRQFYMPSSPPPPHPTAPYCLYPQPLSMKTTVFMSHKQKTTTVRNLVLYVKARTKIKGEFLTKKLKIEDQVEDLETDGR
jgi:hypothetical protein